MYPVPLLASMKQWLERLPDHALLVALIGALLAAAAWTIQRLISVLTKRAELRIVEALSSCESLSRSELHHALRHEHFLFYVATDVANDALAGLVAAGRVTVLETGRYALVHPTASSPPRLTKRRGRRG
jgi:hypothetical protein